MTQNSTETYLYCGALLDRGQIIPLRVLKRGAEGWAVVTDVKCARWRGEDQDVYAHVEYWYEARPATPEETAKGERYAEASQAWRDVLKALGNPSVERVDEQGIHTRALRMLDSYDDRFDGSSKCIPLTEEQRAIYNAFLGAPQPVVKELAEEETGQ